MRNVIDSSDHVVEDDHQCEDFDRDPYVADYKNRKPNRFAECFKNLAWELVGILFVSVVFAVIGVSFGLDFEDNSQKSTPVVGKCFVTISGAEGVAESLSLTGKITLAFPSGLKETYDPSRLDETPCDQD